MVYAEVKIGKDKLSPDQDKYLMAIHDVMRHNNGVHYVIITESNYEDIFNFVVTKDFQGLEHYIDGDK